jgi:endo-1,4-beta-xylanase
MQRRSFLQLSLGTLAASAIPNARKVAQPGTLREVADAKGLLVGTCVSYPELQRPELTTLLANQYSVLVPEVEMKWRITHPAPDRYDFTRADALMTFAEAQHLRVRGHNLCWHEHNPEWLESTASSENAANLLRTHIQTVAGRYKSRIHSWDVVNEAIKPEHHNPHDMQDSIWLKTLGEDYIDLAFRTAAEADPSALLTYNEYDLETDTPDQQAKRDAVLALLRRMRKKNTPLHALGVQSHLKAHLNEQPKWKGLNEFLNEVEKLGLQVYLTELDVNDSDLPDDIPERDRLVADLYSSYLRNLLPRKSVKAVLTWGFIDPDTWLNRHSPRKDGSPQRPLPFDANLNPKPAFFALRDSLAAKS